MALNSIMAAVHFFLLSHTFPRIVPSSKAKGERAGRPDARGFLAKKKKRLAEEDEEDEGRKRGRTKRVNEGCSECLSFSSPSLLVLSAG